MEINDALFTSLCVTAKSVMSQFYLISKLVFVVALSDGTVSLGMILKNIYLKNSTRLLKTSLYFKIETKSKSHIYFDAD